jgi:hypothetical protein
LAGSDILVAELHEGQDDVFYVGGEVLLE